MQAQYYDKVYEVPDELGEDPVAIRSWIEKNAVPQAGGGEPSLWTYTKGALQTGGAEFYHNIANISNLVGAGGIENIAREKEAEARAMKSAMITAAQPPTSTLGQLAYGVGTFVPELPLYLGGEAVAMQGLKMIPKVGARAAEALTAVKGEGILAGTGRAVGRGALAGAAVGSVAAEPGSDALGRAGHAYEEAKEFAVGVGILHPAFSLVRKAVGMALGKSAARVRSDADVRAAMESEKFQEQLKKDADLANQLKQYEEMRDAQSALEKERERVDWYEENQPFGQTVEPEPGFGLEGRRRPPPTPPTEPPSGGAPAPTLPEGARAGGSGQVGEPARLDQSLVQGIPDFRGTEDAMKFGIANKERLPEMQALNEQLKATALDKNKPMPERSAAAYRSSKLTEAIEAAQGIFGAIPEKTLERNPEIKAAREAAIAAGVDQNMKPGAPIAVEPKRLSVKFVSEELGRRLSGLGATREEVKAIVDQVVNKPMTDLAVRRELMLREFSSEDVAKLKPEKRREELNKLLVEERLDAEIEKRAPSERVEDKGLSVTPELTAAIRFEQQVRKVAEAEGIPLEKVAERTPEEIKDAYKRIMNGEVVEPAVKQAAPIIGKTDARGLELADKVLEAGKNIEHPEYTPERLRIIRDDLAIFMDQLRSAKGEELIKTAGGTFETARKRRRLEPKPQVTKEKTPEQLAEEREIQEWLDSEATPTEIAEKIAETGKPAPKAVETAEDWNKLLADEGMPEEPAGTILDFAGLQKMYEMIRENLMKSTNPKELAKLGRGLMLEGSKDFDKFKARVQEISGPSWDSVKGNIRNMYRDAKEWHDKLEQNGQITYHGTKAHFERFSDEKIGSGEGAQVYGYGHYLTSKEDVAKWYAHNVGDSGAVKARGVDVFVGPVDEQVLNPKLFSEKVPGDWTADAIYRMVDKDEANFNSNKKQVIVELESSLVAKERPWVEGWADEKQAAEFQEGIAELLAFIKGLEFKDLKMEAAKVVHAVEIPRDLKLLDLDKRIEGETASTLHKALLKLKEDRVVDAEDSGTALDALIRETGPDVTQRHYDLDGHKLLGGLEAVFSNTGVRYVDANGNVRYRATDRGAKDASNFLREAGFHGNTYIGRTSGERNYVIFDEKVPKVVGSYTLDFMGLQQGLEAFLGIARDFRKDGKSIVARELGEQMLGKNGKEWLVDRRPAFDKVRIWEIQARDPKRVGLKIGGSGEKLVFDLNEAELRYQYEVKGPDGHYSLFKAIASKLSEAQQIELTKVLDGKAKPTSVGVAEAAATLKDWFKIMWDKRIKAQLADFESHLKPEENEALLNVINKGMDPGIAFAKFEPKDQKVLKSLLDDYRDLQKRKIENYRPHVERGDILLQTQNEKGKFTTVAVALNSKDAVRKALELREANPDINLFLNTNFAKDLPQGISKGQYWKIAARLGRANADLLKAVNDEIAKGEAATAARRAMRGTFVIKPTQKFSEFELRRMGILKGEENVFDTIFSYAYKTEKKLALDPVIAQARKVINDDYAGQPNTQHFLRELVEDVKGTYSWQDKAADDLVRWLGFEGQSMTATRAAANIRMVEGYLKLGWRPVSALFNYLGGQSNVWAKFGQQYFREGYEFLKTPEGKKFIKEMEPVMGQTFAHEGEQLTIRTGKQLGIDWTKLPPALRWFQPMALFEAPEIPNRSIGLAAPYMYALKELKLPEAAARNFAMRQNWFSQATYNMASMPKLMRSPLGRTAGQFKTYMVNQIEFMATLRGPEAFRYIAAQIALGGPRGAVSFLKSVPFLAMMPWWDEMEDWMNKEYPNFSRGVVGGMLGMDVTGPSTLQFPTTVTDWLGPFVNDVIKVHRNVVSPYLEGAKPMPKTPGEAAEIPFSALEQVSPVIRYWPKLLVDRIAHPSQDSYIIKDQRGREIYRLEPFDLVKEVMGGTPTEAARMTQFQANERRRQKVENLRKGHVVDAVMEAMAEGNEIPDGYIEELIALGIKPASLRREAKLRSLPPEIRMMLQTQLSKRADLLERHPYQGD